MYEEDLDIILASRHDNGADFWATADGRLEIERPISTLSALLIMSELRVPKSHEALQGAAELVMNACGEDGRIRISPKGAIYPCSTAIAAAALCRNGYSDHSTVGRMLQHLMSNRFEDGGWRCKKFFYGHGPETNYSNPGVTLFALDAFRFTQNNDELNELDAAIETLLNHWDVKVPTGPCHYGIGKQFMQVEYPFMRYNLFYYTYVLSFYPKAREDKRFQDALAVLGSKCSGQNLMIVERPSRKLENLEICRKGEPSIAATERYAEIMQNMQNR